MRPFLKQVLGLDGMLKLLFVFFAHVFTLTALAGQVDHERLIQADQEGWSSHKLGLVVQS